MTRPHTPATGHLRRMDNPPAVPHDAARLAGCDCLDRIRRAGVHDEDCRVVRQWLAFDRLISDRQEES